MGNNNLIKYNRIPWVKALAIHLTHSNSETNRICSCDIHSQGKQQKKEDLTDNKKNATIVPLHKSDKNRKNNHSYSV